MPRGGGNETGGDHACSACDDRATLAAHAAAVVRRGRDQAMRVMPVLHTPDVTAAEALVADEWIRLTATGQLELHAIADGYGTVDPDRPLARYHDAIGLADCDGFSALSVVADATRLTGRGERCAAVAAVGASRRRTMDESGDFNAMYMSDTTAVDPDDLKVLAVTHPHTVGVSPPFSMFVDDDTLACRGEFERFDVDLLRRRVDAVPTDTTDVVVDFARVTYIDHHTLHAFDQFAADAKLAAHLRAASAVAAGMAEVLGLRHLVIREAPWTT